MVITGLFDDGVEHPRVPGFEGSGLIVKAGKNG